ncbi:MAG TPA: DUF2975 domain-containing protein [Candidatus Saccharimonadales bacterium]|nr:DUF2975 domain-containing protein [Candidatus Saccharimonadales bacterium]
MKQGTTIFLRGAIVLIGLAALAICIFLLPAGISSDETGMYRPILAGMYLPAVPFFLALYQALKLLGYIDKNNAFSDLAVRALGRIKYCAVAISALFAAGMPYIFHAADKDDAPGVVALGLVIVFASFVIATAAALFQRLFQNALDIKSENDLTV